MANSISLASRYVRHLVLAAAASLLGVTAPALGFPPVPEGIILLEPVMESAGQVRMRASPSGRRVPVARRATDTPLARLALEKLNQGLIAELPALDREARHASAIDTACPATGPNLVIYFSAEDGGYARQGFYLADENSGEPFCNDYYIDLTVDPRSIDSGEFEEVLAHEWGHIMLRRILGSLPPTPSRKFHSVLATTDPVTAFDEGIGIHLQSVAAQLTTTGGFRSRINGTAPPSAADFWFSRRETRLRYDWVGSNQLIYSKLPVREATPYERYLATERSTALDYCSLRSGDELVASEGFVGSFVFKLMASELADRDDPAGIRRAYSRLIRVLASMGGWREREAPLLAFVKAWSTGNPEDGKRITRLFVELSNGATAASTVRKASEAASCAGARGDMSAFRSALASARGAQADLVEAITSGQTALSDALGPQLWIARADIVVAKAPWVTTRTEPLTLDLNSASEAELSLAFLGRSFAPAFAARLVTERRANGPFADLDALRQRLALDNRQIAQLAAMAQAFASLPPFIRD